MRHAGLPASLEVAVDRVHLREPGLPADLHEENWGMTLKRFVLAAMICGIAASEPAAAQDYDFYLALRGGVAMPVGEVSDVAEAGAVIGVGIGFQVARGLYLIADGDFGFHSPAETAGAAGIDLDIYHSMAKVGYDVLSGSPGPWTLILNAGGGLMMFNVKGGDTFTYLAANVGAKLAYDILPRFSLGLSLQGDVAFADAAEVGTETAWVLPLALGVAIKL